MNQIYGTRVTIIVTRTNPERSTYWQRRLVMLVPINKTSAALSGRCATWLFAFVISVCLLPTIRLAPVLADQPSTAVAQTSVGNDGKTADAAPEREPDPDLVRGAENGDFWAKYKLWAAYAKGADGVKKDPEKAKKWLAALVDETYVAKFQPINGFAPRTPGEFLSQFHDHSNLRSEPAGLGGASFFRTAAKDGVLIGSFLTAYPDKMRRDISANPSLKLISIEKVTPDMFVRYEASPQDSLDDEKPVKAAPDSVRGAGKAAAIELHYDDGKVAGKRSLGGSGEMIQFTLPGDNGKVTGIRVHGSRYGMPQPPAENFVIYGVSEDESEVLFTETAPYKLFARGNEKWVDVTFKRPREVPKNFWIVLDFKAHQTKGVYVSFDTSAGGKHSKTGLPGQQSEKVDFDGDWLIRVKVAK